MSAQQKAALAFRDQTVSELAASKQMNDAQAQIAANNQVRTHRNGCAWVHLVLACLVGEAALTCGCGGSDML